MVIRVMLIVFSVFTSSCSDLSLMANSDDGVYISLKNIMKASDKYSGRDLMISGYLTTDRYNLLLYSHENGYENADFVFLKINLKEIDLNEIEKCLDRQVVITGQYEHMQYVKSMSNTIVVAGIKLISKIQLSDGSYFCLKFKGAEKQLR